ncbi:LysR family transcriptional regulator [Acidovorax sp. NPDC077693]|uniref:LysR family transcriptional regulator n=1 Tax=unclassified Acidovorax TaxID=2684926 RepID=UPI0037CA4D3C
MYLRHLEYLRSIIEHGSFARAALACGVSQPAISQGMKSLQAHFAAPLLVRQGRRYLPTDLARAVSAEAASVGERIDELRRLGTGTAERHQLRVGLTSSAALVCGPVLYRGWCVPQGRRSLAMATADEGSLLAGLLHGRFDAVIAPRPRKFDHADVSARRLYDLQPLVYARRRHPLVQARSLAQLQGAAWACVGPSVSGPVDVLTEAHRVRRMPAPRMAVRCPDFASLLNLVAMSDLLAVVPHPALLGAAAPQVAALRLAEALPLYAMWLFELRHHAPRIGPQLWADLVAAGEPVV